MANPYFRFKQFVIYQDKCAMKVCTDACILGAWSAGKIYEQANEIKRILDIGCGTGLLSLMLAQQSTALIDAIEIQHDAAQQAAENARSSPWKHRINIIHTSLQEYAPGKKYDFIISNPPFYENDLKPADEHKNAAKHDSTLRLDELVIFIDEYLDENGIAVLLLPYHRTVYVETLIEKLSLFAVEKVYIKQSEKHDHFRSLLMLSKKEKQHVPVNTFSIHNGERQYTQEFEALLKDYYLNL